MTDEFVLADLHLFGKSLFIEKEQKKKHDWIKINLTYPKIQKLDYIL